MQKHILALYAPLIVSNILHMFVVKHNFLSPLRIPLAPVAFGNHKTYRGFLFVPIINGIFLYILNSFYKLNLPINSLLLGGILGLAYLLFELPNSFIKRRLGIAPGEKSKIYKKIFIIIDRCDSAFGISLVYSLILNLTFLDFFFLFSLASFIHFFFSFLLVKVGVKESL